MHHHRIDRIPPEWGIYFRPGRRLAAIDHASSGRYHGQAYLEFEDGEVFKATAAEHDLAPLFDCFSLAIELVAPPDYKARRSIRDFEIRETFALIRDEWLLSAPHLAAQTVGNNPHEQLRGPLGCVPAGAVASATVLGGILMTSRAGHRLAVIAVPDVPLNVDVVERTDHVDHLLATHTSAAIA